MRGRLSLQAAPQVPWQQRLDRRLELIDPQLVEARLEQQHRRQPVGGGRHQGLIGEVWPFLTLRPA